MVFLIKKGRRLIGYEVDLKNVPGALKAVASIPEKYGLNIEYIETCRLIGDVYSLFLAIDFTDVDKEVTPEHILDEMKKNKTYILNAEIAPSIYDVIFPSKLCIKDIGGMRAILLGLGNMKGIINGIKKNMGIDMGSSFLYHLGYGVGKEIYNIYGKPYNLNTIDDAIALLSGLARGGGWADIHKEYANEKQVVITMDSLWECEVSGSNLSDEKPKSNYVRGILAGFFETMLHKKIVVRETQCIGLGDSKCRFEINII